MNREMFNYYLLPQGLKLMFIFMFTVDPSLAIVERLNVIPYSIFWKVLNPFDTTQYTYKLYLVMVDSIISYIMWLRHIYIPHRKWLYTLWQITQLHWFTGFYQNVSVTWFALVIPLSPLLIKLPLGWSLIPWDTSNPHVLCAYNCGVRLTLSPLITYSIIIFWSILPLTLFIKDRWTKHDLNKQIQMNIRDFNND